jgi:hypothetical protein
MISFTSPKVMDPMTDSSHRGFRNWTHDSHGSEAAADGALFLRIVNRLESRHPERWVSFIPRLERFCRVLRFYFAIHPERRHELRAAVRRGRKLDDLLRSNADESRHPRDGPASVPRPAPIPARRPTAAHLPANFDMIA